jgi:hypothetical protein
MASSLRYKWAQDCDVARTLLFPLLGDTSMRIAILCERKYSGVLRWQDDVDCHSGTASSKAAARVQ